MLDLNINLASQLLLGVFVFINCKDTCTERMVSAGPFKLWGHLKDVDDFPLLLAGGRGAAT